MPRGKSNYDFKKCYKFRIYPKNDEEKFILDTIEECRRVYNKLLKGLKIQSYIFKDGYFLDKDRTIFWEKYYTGSGFDLKRKPWEIKEQTEFKDDKDKERYLRQIECLENYKKLYSIFERYFPDCVKSKIDRSATQKIATYYTNIIAKESKEKFYVASLRYENWKIFRQLKSLVSNKSSGRQVGEMNYSGRDFFKSFTYNSGGFKLIYKGGCFGILKLSKIGYLKIRIHREIEGVLKSVIIKKEGNKYFAFLITGELKEEHPKEKKFKIPKGKRVGIDLGLTDFVYDSDGKNWERPKILKLYEDKIAYFNRKLSICKMGSNNRRKVKELLSNIYAKQTRAREDYLHKISNYYVENYSVVCAEDLKINDMIKKEQHKGKGMRKNILDASWGKFLFMLEYKSKERGKLFIRVHPKNTTQTCSKCGNVKEGEDKIDLEDRIYKCDKCGLEIHRDYNASLNILKRGNIILTKELGFATSKEVVSEKLHTKLSLES